jgi:ribosome maturation factor RimP
MEPSFIANLANGSLEGTDKFVVEVLVKPGNRIYVFIDGDHGVTIEDCVRLSRFIESQLDRENEDFELNVSSSGADQPIRLPRQYPKNVGRSLHVKLADDQEVTGKLTAVDPSGIILDIPADKKKKIQEHSRTIAFELIREAKVIISFK